MDGSALFLDMTLKLSVLSTAFRDAERLWPTQNFARHLWALLEFHYA